VNRCRYRRDPRCISWAIRLPVMADHVKAHCAVSAGWRLFQEAVFRNLRVTLCVLVEMGMLQKTGLRTVGSRCRDSFLETDGWLRIASARCDRLTSAQTAFQCSCRSFTRDPSLPAASPSSMADVGISPMNDRVRSGHLLPSASQRSCVSTNNGYEPGRDGDTTHQLGHPQKKR
jgi:hypothetical protein